MSKKKTMKSESDFFQMDPDSAPGFAGSGAHAPLAVRMRPRILEEVVGQSHLLGEGKLLPRTLQSDRWTSMIFYGPPGSGKTTLAQVISRVTRSYFEPLNAVGSNVQDLRRVIQRAKDRLRANQKRTLLFIDEIHRFNKAQQDVLMPDVEEGNVVLIGATTHNPSFAINGPLLSRSTVFELRPLEEHELIQIVKNALTDKERGLGLKKIEIGRQALEHLAKQASGDARRALNALEIGVMTTAPDAQGIVHFDLQVAEASSQRKVVYYDADEDYHYDTISAFIKSIRGSQADAAVYWLAKMLYAGEDPRFIMRRLLILASEDIGNADPQALILASAGLQAVEFVGLPEARIILSQMVLYLALAPKSNASYQAISEATQDVESGKVEEVPAHLRDKSYKGAEKLGHGQGYHYPHREDMEFPQSEHDFITVKKQYYRPHDSGFEKVLRERLQAIIQANKKS